MYFKINQYSNIAFLLFVFQFYKKHLNLTLFPGCLLRNLLSVTSQ